MSWIARDREAASIAGGRYSVVSYVIFAAARVLARHPEANCAMGSGLRPKVVEFSSVDAKLALDKTLDGQRVVVSGRIEHADRTGLDGIQSQVNRYREASPDELPECRDLLRLHALPSWLGWWGFCFALRRLRDRSRYMGTFAVSSLGHRPIDGFHAVGGGAITLNLGQTRDCAVVRDGALAVAPLLRLNLTFDHRVLDGAAAADVLAEIKAALESGAGLRGPVSMRRNAHSDGAYLAELKQLVVLHARAVSLPVRKCTQLLARIDAAAGDESSSWATVWSAAAVASAQRGRHLQASAYYGIARFPFVDEAPRAAALLGCVTAFARWAEAQGAQRIEVPVGAGRVVVWLKPVRTRQILLVMGGIVSIKEQWSGLLARADRLGMSVALTEMPGVGENTLRYDLDSWRMISAVLDRIAEATGGCTTVHVLAFSFGGHLALRAALADARIRSVITVGAPIAQFFNTAVDGKSVPETTRRTLAHLARVSRGELPAHLAPMALSTQELERLAIPVYYVASRRDEIIDAAEPALLQRHAARVRVIEYDDVHGSPNHLFEMRLEIMRILLQLRDRHAVQRAVLGGLLSVLSGGRRMLRGSA